MRKLVGGVLAGLFALSLTTAASAFTGGDPGASGKTAGNTCGNASCHTGGPTPTVKIDGPATLAAGATGQYTFTVTTSLTKTGMGVAGSDGVTFTAGTGDQISSGEVAQSSPQAVTSGATTYTFSVVAPTTGSSMTLYGCGVGANGDGNSTGDGAATTTLAVTLTGGGAAAPASSSSASTSTGDDDDSTSTKSTKTTTTSPADPWNDTQSCAAQGGPSPTGLVAATFLVLGLVATTRRRRK